MGVPLMSIEELTARVIDQEARLRTLQEDLDAHALVLSWLLGEHHQPGAAQRFLRGQALEESPAAPALPGLCEVLNALAFPSYGKRGRRGNTGLGMRQRA